MFKKLTFYTDKFIPAKFGGVCIGPVILIRPKYKDDVGLLRHEEEHRKQWTHTLGLHSLLYAVSRPYRQWAEVAAYREQLKHYPDDRSARFAEFLATKYNLRLTVDEALKLLKEA